MYRPLTDLLEDSVACAEAQVEAVKAFDVERLRALTAEREDLLFLIRSEGKQRLEEADDETRALAAELRELDERLERLLNSGLGVLHRVRTGQPPTYAPDGRLRNDGS